MTKWQALGRLAQCNPVGFSWVSLSTLIYASEFILCSIILAQKYGSVTFALTLQRYVAGTKRELQVPGFEAGLGRRPIQLQEDSIAFQ